MMHLTCFVYNGTGYLFRFRSKHSCLAVPGSTFGVALLRIGLVPSFIITFGLSFRVIWSMTGTIPARNWFPRRNFPDCFVMFLHLVFLPVCRSPLLESKKLPVQNQRSFHDFCVTLSAPMTSGRYFSGARKYLMWCT